ncbi:MAG: DNA-directed RNA polymerase subunit omega [Rubrobacteraceae bacterium]|jgi:DNA-directed RNA polymerase subunit omega|nr:DNA-directed RNA polymerase subunit omega [Rubrobacter sp.]
MLNELKVDEILDSGKVDSRYGLVLASAKRARQINEYTATLGLNESLGIPGPQVHTRSQHPLSIAIEELREDRLKVGFREPAEEEAAEAKTAEEAAAGDAADGFMNDSPGVAPGAAEVSEEPSEGADDEGAA